MPLAAELKTLYHLMLSPIKGDTHAQRLENFYGKQAEHYDAFRKRLLHGRQELWNRLPVAPGEVWVDLGGGTGANLEHIGQDISQLGKVYVVDLAPSLLKVAQQRCEANGWGNVTPVEADATTFRPTEGGADAVTLSYSLTMIPDWFAALENAWAMLKPGGRIALVDFYVSRKYPATPHRRHRWLTRSFWPTWFGCDNVFLSPDHVPYLHRRFEVSHFSEHSAPVPYLPLVRVPYYLFIGRKPLESTPPV